MSVKVMSLVWDHYPGGGGELLLALALADWANHDGDGIWAAISKMADKTRQSARTVQYQLRRMQSSGWLRIVETGGGRRTTTYRIPVELIPQTAEGVVQNLRPSLTTTDENGPKRTAADCAPGVQSATRGVQPDVSRGATAIAPEPLYTSCKPSKAEERAARATRLPRTWSLPKTWGDWALAERPDWTPDNVRKVAEKFKDHWISAPKGTKLHWFATWRNWVRGEPSPKGAINGAAKPWFLTASGIEAKAKELGVEVPSSKEGWAAFRTSVYQRAGVTDEMLKAARQDAPR